MEIEKWILANGSMTDIHLTEGEPVVIRQNGNLRKMKEMADISLFHELFEKYLSPSKKAEFGEKGSCDGAFSVGNTRIRLHIYQSFGKMAAALRILPDLSLLPPDLDKDWLERTAALDHGLVLICGPSGSGKSTTLSRLISLINTRRACHIVTLEDPVEYYISSVKSLVHQREVGRDVPSFAEGIRDSLREDPDVIAVGEMRDSATISAALTAAETGHLVLGTLHTTRAADSVSRIIHAYSGEREREARSLLSASLKTVCAQQLYRTAKDTILLREILTNTPAISHLIREGKEEQIPSYMEMGLHQMRTLKQAAYGLRNISERERDKLLKYLEL